MLSGFGYTNPRPQTSSISSWPSPVKVKGLFSQGRFLDDESVNTTGPREKANGSANLLAYEFGLGDAKVSAAVISVFC